MPGWSRSPAAERLVYLYEEDDRVDCLTRVPSTQGLFLTAPVKRASPQPNVLKMLLEFPQPEGLGQQGNTRVTIG